MKTLANCTPAEFLKQTNRMRKRVGSLLKDSKVGEIRKRKPALTGEETEEQKKALYRKQAEDNISAMLDLLLENYAERTAEVLGMMCFIEPEDINNHRALDFLSPAVEVLNDQSVVDFLSSLMKSEILNTGG